MGDNEATVSRYYIKKLEPDTGRAWFEIRPVRTRRTYRRVDCLPLSPAATICAALQDVATAAEFGALTIWDVDY